MDHYASVKIEDSRFSKSVGRRVNPHVVRRVETPTPDFDAMNRLLRAADENAEGHDKNVTSEQKRRQLPKDD